MRSIILAAAISLPTVLAAQDVEVNIAPDLPSVTVETRSGPVEISRVQDTGNRIEGDWTLTSRPCPNFCIQPIVPAPGVTAVGELELLELMQEPDVVLADGRIRPQYEEGTIPGAISLPYNESADRLDVLGCEIDFDGFLCEDRDLNRVVLFCNGPWCGQSPTAARRMIEAGFPAENIYYYRGGMQVWRLLGLTVVPGV